MQVTDSIALLGTVNALLLAIAAGVASRRDSRWAWLSLLFTLLSVTVAAIILSHRTDGLPQRVAVAVEQLAWGVGPALYLHVRRAIGCSVTVRHAAAHFLVPFLVLAVWSPLIVSGRSEPVPAGLLILFQLAYTAVSTTLFLRRSSRHDRSAVGYWWPVAILASMGAIHIAQLTRFSPLGERAPDVVPLIGSIAGVALVLLALLLAHQVAQRQVRYAKSAIPDDRARAIFAQAREALEAQQLYRRFDISLPDLSAAIGVAPHQLSQALSASGSSFADLIAGLRTEEAKRLLLAPANEKVAVEPIGMEAGFRSRSSFYEAFRARTGATPAEYRRLKGRNMSGPSGPDTELLA